MCNIYVCKWAQTNDPCEDHSIRHQQIRNGGGWSLHASSIGPLLPCYPIKTASSDLWSTISGHFLERKGMICLHCWRQEGNPIHDARWTWPVLFWLGRRHVRPTQQVLPLSWQKPPSENILSFPIYSTAFPSFTHTQKSIGREWLSLRQTFHSPLHCKWEKHSVLQNHTSPG